MPQVLQPMQTERDSICCLQLKDPPNRLAYSSMIFANARAHSVHTVSSFAAVRAPEPEIAVTAAANSGRQYFPKATFIRMLRRVGFEAITRVSLYRSRVDRASPARAAYGPRSPIRCARRSDLQYRPDNTSDGKSQHVGSSNWLNVWVAEFHGHEVAQSGTLTDGLASYVYVRYEASLGLP